MAGTKPCRVLFLWLALGGWLVGCGAERAPHSDAAPASNLLLISIDTLRADHLGAWGYARATSPNLDALAGESVVFERALAQSSWTLPSFASVMTSLYSSTHLCWTFTSVLADSYTTLAEILLAQGFDTAAVVSHIFVGSRHGMNQGFEAFDEELVLDNPAESHRAIASPRVTSKGLRWLAKRAPQDSRWFLWLHYFDPHAVYREHPGLEVDFPIESEEDRYDAEIAFTDRAIGELLAGLERLKLSEDTLVVVVADHGEEFGDHGGTGHGVTLYREAIHVPLLMRIPGHGPRRIEAAVRSVDIMPTVLELLGISPDATGPVDDWEGVSLGATIRGQAAPDLAAVAELGVNRTTRRDSIERGRWKLILDQTNGTISLFDVESDPSETVNVALDEPRIVGDLERELSDSIDAAEAKAKHYRAAKPLDLSHEQEENLRKLGYVQ